MAANINHDAFVLRQQAVASLSQPSSFAGAVERTRVPLRLLSRSILANSLPLDTEATTASYYEINSVVCIDLVVVLIVAALVLQMTLPEGEHQPRANRRVTRFVVCSLPIPS